MCKQLYLKVIVGKNKVMVVEERRRQGVLCKSMVRIHKWLENFSTWEMCWIREANVKIELENRFK